MSGDQPLRAGSSTVAAVPGRRQAVSLLAGAGLALALPGRRPARAAANPAKEPPQTGDEFVFVGGGRKGRAIMPADLQTSGLMIEAWAKDAKSGTVRSGSRLHRVLLLRLDPGSLDAKTRERAAEGGIVAYSGFCTHAGCPVQHWKAAEQRIRCHCHESEFDPRANGKVVGGPAKRPLAGLPIRLEADRLVVAGTFASKLGPPKA